MGPGRPDYREWTCGFFFLCKQRCAAGLFALRFVRVSEPVLLRTAVSRKRQQLFCVLNPNLFFFFFFLLSLQKK